LPFPPFETPGLRVEEALAEKIRATQQRAAERDPYDRMGYGRKGLDERLVRLLSVAKLWSARRELDPARVLRTLAEVRREWPDLARSSGGPARGTGTSRRGTQPHGSASSRR
jgi:predicted nucleotidyltransferase component of viral defense system